MITTDLRGSVVSIAVLGEFTLGDFKEFEDLVLSKVKFDGRLTCFSTCGLADFTVDMAWEEIKFSRQHGGDFRRIAVLTESQWVTWSAWLEQSFVSADLRVFADEVEARAWLAEDKPA